MAFQHSPPLPTNYQLLLSATPTLQSGAVLSSPLILHRQNTILAKHQQASHHSIISQSINFVLLELAIPCKQTENVVVQTSLCKRVKVQVSNISTHCTARRLKPAGVSAVTRSSVDAPNREQRYLIVFILYDH